VHLIDDEYFVLALLWLKPDLLYQGADMLHTVVGSRIEFHDVEGSISIKCFAAITRAAWFKIGSLVLAVEYFGEYPCTGRFAHTPWPAEQKGMRQMVGLQCLLQCLRHMLLAYDFIKPGRAIFSGGYYVTHVFSMQLTVGSLQEYAPW
jgi:hypothetical protein